MILLKNQVVVIRMKDTIDDLINNISSEHIKEGNNEVKIIFHEGNWKDIFITYTPDNSETDMEIIKKTDLREIINRLLPFPKYGEIMFNFYLNNEKEIIYYKIKKTYRIHNRKY